ncbi:MAG TPA: hypothetical protein VF407_01160 [Polyangiaceae bacterium]
MEPDRVPCCLDPKTRVPCGTRWDALRKWACSTTGKGVRVVTLGGSEQGKAPFFAQPVGYDGRSFMLGFDHGCDTEKLLHDVCHWLVAPKERRSKMNFGLGPGPTTVSELESDNEEVTVMLLEQRLAPLFRLSPDKIAKPDYNVADRRNLDWDACEARAEAIFESIRSGIPA